MVNNFNFTRPQTLIIGAIYLYRERIVLGRQKPPTVVRFLCYDACPAIVIVHTLDGSKQRCLREELYSLGESDHQSSSIQLSSFFQRHFIKVKTPQRNANHKL